MKHYTGLIAFLGSLFVVVVIAIVRAPTTDEKIPGLKMQKIQYECHQYNVLQQRGRVVGFVHDPYCTADSTYESVVPEVELPQRPQPPAERAVSI